jgi:hypothetical protein
MCRDAVIITDRSTVLAGESAGLAGRRDTFNGMGT